MAWSRPYSAVIGRSGGTWRVTLIVAEQSKAVGDVGALVQQLGAIERLRLLTMDDRFGAGLLEQRSDELCKQRASERQTSRVSTSWSAPAGRRRAT